MAKKGFSILGYSKDKHRVAVSVTRNGVRGKYMVVKGFNSFVWVRPRGRSYIITADKCNCPASRGQCKHVLVLTALKGMGFFPEEKWVKWKPEVSAHGKG